MITAYSAAGWTQFGIAAAGAAATLARLLFVAVSINLQRILEFPNLPGRAGLTLILFVTPMFIGFFVIVPGKARTALAWESRRRR